MQRLVSHQNPEARETPLLVLAELRDIDPTAELCYAGKGQWWLGSVSDNPERRRRAENMMQQITAMERQQQSARTLMLCALNLQGFALIESYWGTDPAGAVEVRGEETYTTTIVEDFRWRDAEWRRDRGSSVVKSRLLDTLGEPERIEAEAQMKEYLANDGRDQFRRHMKGKFSFGYGGMTGGNNTLILP